MLPLFFRSYHGGPLFFDLEKDFEGVSIANPFTVESTTIKMTSLKGFIIVFLHIIKRMKLVTITKVASNFERGTIR